MVAGKAASATDRPIRGIAAPRAGTVDRALLGWAALGITALGLAGAFAFLLAVSRIPGIERLISWPIGFFYKGLVIHVTFSFVVWFLAVFGILNALACRAAADRNAVETPAGSIAGVAAFAGLAAAAVAMPLLFVPAFFDRGEATLNNYVPTIIDPLYYAGLVLLAIAVAGPAAALAGSLLTAGRQSLTRPLPLAMAAAVVVYALALVCFIAAGALQQFEPITFGYNEQIFWGGGHVLQILNTLLLIVAWSWLAARAADGPVLPRLAFFAAAGILVLLAVIAPFFYLLYAPFSAAQTNAFTALQYGLGPAALIVAGALFVAAPRPLPWARWELQCLALSFLLFAVGGGFGLFVDGADTRTPAHYHGVIAAVTLAFMGLFYAVFLPALGKPAPRERMVRIQLHLFAWGQLAACIGLFLAGGHGAPRKVAGDAQGLYELSARIGMGLNGFGALVAIIGGILFVWLVARALLRHEAIRPRILVSRFWR
ncbi:MAG: cbb3-type cytochrome c oxidase subunit I [Rhodospirillales bacterium]|nr:cbb3-type cytochrome c oxidase subunit I [Rhodospirillales bacterium]